MRHGFRSGRTRAAGGSARLFTLAALAVLAAALGPVAGSAAAIKIKPAKTVWLCKPGIAADPCTGPLTSTVVQTDGETSEEKAKKNSRAPIDCFYVYPTVSEQPTTNANLEIEPQET